MSVRRRLTLWYTSTLIAMLLGFAAVIFVGGPLQLRHSTDQELLQTARLLAEALQRNEDPVVVDTSYRLLRLDGEIVRVAGLPAPRVLVNPRALAAARQGQTWWETVWTVQVPPEEKGRLIGLLTQVRVLTIPLGQPPTAILQVGKVTNDVPRLRGLLITTLLVALGLGLPLAMLGGWWLAGRALAPVRAMTETARRIEAENLAERLPQPPQDELGQLAVTLNGLLDRLQAAFQRERRFTSDVSHDLRTPLALVKSTIGVALNRPRSAEELSTTLAEVDRQVDRVTSLLDAILFLARADARQLQRNYVPVDLSELLTDLYETTVGYASEERGLTLTCDIPSGLWVHGDHDQLTRVFLNLLDNAMDYTPRGGAIRLAAYADGRQVAASVQDNGIGIAPEDLPRIFDRFYRADKARGGSERGHYGLGLSIAQAIARAHGGEIVAQSTPDQGSCFTVNLPLVVYSGSTISLLHQKG